MEPATPAPMPPTTEKENIVTTTTSTTTSTTTNVKIVQKTETEPDIAMGGIFDGQSGVTEQATAEPLAIPIWVWILVAIIGVIVILCIVLVMTR